jgi:hypothetical protein
MKTLYLTLMIGMLMLSVVGAGLIYDSVREKPVEEKDIAILTRALGGTDYEIVRTDRGEYIEIKIGVYTRTINKLSSCGQEKFMYPESACKEDIYKTEKEIQTAIDKIENDYLQFQKSRQETKESAPTRTPTKTELVTITEAELIDEILGGVVRLK